MTDAPTQALPASAPVSAWIDRWLARVSVGDRVLDFASGRGRNMRRALEQGATVLAVDIDSQAVAGIDPRADRRVCDLEATPWPLQRGAWDVVIVANYLFRPRFALLADLLAPGGALLYETFAQGNERYGRPASPEYLLRDGELLERARQAGLSVIAYEAGFTERPRPARVQRLCAVRPPVDERRWQLDLRVG